MIMSSDDLAGLRHDLRTPLNHIIGFTEMLLEEATDEDSPTLVPALRLLHEHARDLLGRLNALFAAAASDADYAPQRLEATLLPSLRRVIQGMEALRAEAAASGTSRIRGDVERIAAAAQRLLGLIVPQEAAAAAASTAAKPQARAGQGAILVVDDNEGNREMLSRRLARQGYTTITAEDGRSAFDLLRGRPVDLVLLDVMMPGMDGYEVLKRMKSDYALRHIPVLMISAHDEVDSVIRCIGLGAEDYLPKPFNAVLLHARIGACLEKKRLRDQEVRHIRELSEWNLTLERRVEEQVAQVERLSRLKRFFSPQLAELMVSGGADDPLKTHRREITVVFLDLRGFTAFAETAEPEEVMGILHDYHASMGKLIVAHEGTLERFTGDGMMVFFNDPVAVQNPAERAVRMAVAMSARVLELSKAWKKQGFDLALGIGIAQGYATIGAIGFEGRWDYGAIGTVTNLAARLCAEAKAGQILVAQRVGTLVENMAEAEDIGDLPLRGLQRSVRTYNIVRLKE
jgi:class 3 adenylate cyclase/CheY-like chemotaxis protein